VLDFREYGSFFSYRIRESFSSCEATLNCAVMRRRPLKQLWLAVLERLCLSGIMGDIVL
jgi:hypothetical protein